MTTRDDRERAFAKNSQLIRSSHSRSTHVATRSSEWAAATSWAAPVGMAAPAGMLVLQGGRQPEPRESRDGALDKLERDRAREIQIVGIGISAFTATPRVVNVARRASRALRLL
jgi:hypothetical protein